MGIVTDLWCFSIKPFLYQVFWYPHLIPRGEGRADPPSYLKNRCPHEPEILQGIRDTFESLRNVKVTYIVFTWLP